MNLANPAANFLVEEASYQLGRPIHAARREMLLQHLASFVTREAGKQVDFQ